MPAKNNSSPMSQPSRKPYVRPSVEVVELRVKDDVLAVCRTTSTASPGASCKITPCFS